MTSSSKELPTKKRARVEDEDLFCTTKRTEELTHKIQDLAKSFPELKYIIKLSNLSKIVATAAVKYKNEVKNEKDSFIYKMPDEILKSCLSFVGKGSFLLVAPVSKKFRHVYKTTFKGDHRDEWLTSYSKATITVSTAKYCLDVASKKDKWCYSPREKRVKIFVQAAYKGQIETLKLAQHLDISSFWDEDEDMRLLLRRPIERIAKIGHLNVLQFLHDNFNMHFALPMASRGAAFGGHIHILKWLRDNDILYDIKDGQNDSLCYSALSGGQLETLKWLRKEGFNLSERLITARSPFEIGNMAAAIKTGNMRLIEYCKDLGFSFEVSSCYRRQQCDCLAIETSNIDLIRCCSEIGLEFTERVLDCAYKHVTVDIFKFLRSKSLPWLSETIDHAAELNQFDVLRYAYENGCEWSSGTWQKCMKQKPCINWDMVQYLHENNCPWEPTKLHLNGVNDASDRLKMLEFIFSKKLPLDVKVLFEFIDKEWLKETKLIIEKKVLKEMPESLTYVAKKTSCNLETIQYLHSKGIPFGKGFLRETCYNGDIPNWASENGEILIWALENGCLVENTEEMYKIVKSSNCSKKLLNLLFSSNKFSGLDLIVQRIIRNGLYREGEFGLEQFQLFLDHSCPMSMDVIKTIYKYWLVLDSSNKNLDEIVAFISSSKHSQPSIDELYRYCDEDLDSTDSDEESDVDYGNDLTFWPLFGF